MPTAQGVLAVCVNWNGREVLPELLTSLHDSQYRKLQTVIVDSNSQDGSVDSLPSWVTLLRLSENLGYGAAINAAIRRSSQPHPEYFLLLNNDVTFGPDMIGSLVRFAEESGPGIYAPKILLADLPDRLDAAWGRITWSHVLSSFAGGRAPDGPRWNETRRVELVLGCAMLVHHSVVEKVGLFDENYFMYHEEIDYLFRAGQAEFPVFFCPFAKAFHKSGFGTRKTPLKKTYWLRRNTVYFLKKHRVGLLRWVYFSATLLGSVAFSLLTLRWKRAAAILRGVKDGLAMRTE